MKTNSSNVKHLHLTIPLLLSLSLSSNISNAAKFTADEDFLEKGKQGYNSLFSSDITESSFEPFINNVENNYKQVLDLIKKKEFEQAKEKVAVLIKESPNQAYYFNLRALLEIQEKKPESAEKSYQHALSLDSKNTQALIGLSVLSLEKKHYKAAKQYAQSALEQNSNYVSAYLLLAKVAVHEKGIDEAEKLLLNANEKVQGDINSELIVLKSLNQIYQNKKQPEKILPFAKKLTEHYKNNSAALSFFASSSLANNDLITAETSLRQIIHQEANDIKHRVMLAKLLSKQANKESEIINFLDEAIANSESPTSILALKTTFLIKQEKYQQAYKIADKIETDNPKLNTGKILKGDVFWAKKEFEKARQYYMPAYQMQANTKVMDIILKTYTLENKQQDAIVFLEDELKKHQGNRAIEFKLANLYQHLKQYNKAVKHYEALLTQQEDNVILLNNLAWVYDQIKNPKALALAEKAFKKAPKSGIVADTYGYILLKNNKKQQGLKVLQQASELIPDSSKIQLHLAEAYIANKNRAQARLILQKLIDNNQEKTEASKLMEQL